MKYCCSHNDSPFLFWAAMLSLWKGAWWGCPPARDCGDFPGKATASEQAKEEEEGQKQEVMGAEEANQQHQQGSPKQNPATTPGPSHHTGPTQAVGWQPAAQPPPAMPALQHGATGRNQLQPHWRGHRTPCSDLPRQHKGGTASAASSRLGQRPRARSEPLPMAGARERLSPPTDSHIWILRFGKSYAVKADSCSL